MKKIAPREENILKSDVDTQGVMHFFCTVPGPGIFNFMTIPSVGTVAV
jgi:hypothetical protein